jgi:hypothetical protein
MLCVIVWERKKERKKEMRISMTAVMAMENIMVLMIRGVSSLLFRVCDHHAVRAIICHSLSSSFCQIFPAHRRPYSHPCPDIFQNAIYSG